MLITENNTLLWPTNQWSFPPPFSFVLDVKMFPCVEISDFQYLFKLEKATEVGIKLTLSLKWSINYSVTWSFIKFSLTLISLKEHTALTTEALAYNWKNQTLYLGYRFAEATEISYKFKMRNHFNTDQLG